MGNEKRRGVRAGSLEFCAVQMAVCCSKDGDFFWTTFLGSAGEIPWVSKEAGKGGEYRVQEGW